MKPTEFDTHLEYLGNLPQTEDYNPLREQVVDIISMQYSEVMGQAKHALGVLRLDDLREMTAADQIRQAIEILETITGESNG